jgi:hypothetical protein
LSCLAEVDEYNVAGVLLLAAVCRLVIAVTVRLGCLPILLTISVLLCGHASEIFTRISRLNENIEEVDIKVYDVFGVNKLHSEQEVQCDPGNLPQCQSLLVVDQRL